MGEPDQAALREMIAEAIELCTDLNLLDLIYKLLTQMNI